MTIPHSINCKCKCHAKPADKRLEIVSLQVDDEANRRCFSHAVLVGFTHPVGYRCRDCNQFYGIYSTTDQLRPITGDWTTGSHPNIAPSRFPNVATLGWRLLNWLTPAFAPVWLQERIRDSIRPPTWEIVTRWTMDD